MNRQQEQTRQEIIDVAAKQCGLSGDSIRQLATVLAAEGYAKFEVVEDETLSKLDQVRILAFDPAALIYSDAPGYIQDIRDVLDGEVNNV